jgi:Flp pilus assembly protein TadG
MLVSMVVVLGMAGLAVDLGRGYLEKYRLSRAVDAGVLAAGRSMRLGQNTARSEASSVARLNGVVDGVEGGKTSIAFSTNGFGENTVTMTASKPVPTIFMRVLGQYQMDVATAATAAVAPVDMVLVLDQSGSLGTQGVWNNLRHAARNFVQHFEDRIDQVGLVSFQARADNRFQMAHSFTGPVISAINGMTSAGDTNTGEGLRLADVQFQSGPVRQRSAKVVVFFTDGRPTAFRGVIGAPGNQQDRVMAVKTFGSGLIRGYFDNPDSLPMDALAVPDGCGDVAMCFSWQEAAVRATARQMGLAQAAQLRQRGITIYTIGLGNPAATHPLQQPDLAYLQQLANQGGVVDPNQPQGTAYFAPSAAQLQQVFDLVAQDLLVRLAR